MTTMDWQHESQSVGTCWVALLPQKGCACLRGLQFVAVCPTSQHALSEARLAVAVQPVCVRVLVVGM